MFDLERAIKNWVKKFQKHKSFDEGSLQEMEWHLHDHVDDLKCTGLSEEEAFNKAVLEFGDISPVANEELFNLRPKSKFQFLNTLKINLKISFRSLTKQPFFTVLNTVGLAIGISGALLVGLFIQNELSFDKMIPESERIFRVNIENQTNGEYSQYAVAPGPMAKVLLEDCPQVEQVMRFRDVGTTLIRRSQEVPNIKIPSVFAADSSLFEMFGLELLEGNEESALSTPNSIVMTRKAAKMHFEKGDALGKTLILNDESSYIVSGILADPPKNSFLRDESVFLSISSFSDEHTIAWNSWSFPTFVKLNRHASPEDFQAFLNTVKDRYLIPWAMTFVPGLTVESARAAELESGNFMRFSAIPLLDIHLFSTDRQGEISPNSSLENIYIMSLIGVFLILLAGVNFMNLSTAYSLKRVKEVGIRKSLGSDKTGIIRQFLSESIMIGYLSVSIALVFTYLTLPVFNTLADKSIIIPFLSLDFWIVVMLSGLVFGILAGIYPAIYMSKFRAIEVLKGKNVKTGGVTIRNGLVIFQFGISVFLIVSTLVVYEQVDFISNKDLGYQKDQILILEDIQTAGKKVNALKEEIQRLPSVNAVSLSSYLPTPSERGSTTYFIEGALEDGKFNSNNAMIIGQWSVDEDYIKTLNLELLSGRDFSKEFGTDDRSVIINESTLKMIGATADEVIGKRITEDFHRDDKENMEYLTVIGVVKNFHFETLRNNIDALSFVLGEHPKRMIIRLSSADYGQTLGAIEEKWESVVPNSNFNYYFLDDSFGETYKAETRLGTIFMIFTTLSIFIACIGLFGLTTFNSERRTKEIGIKKVLGASTKLITYQLAMDFLKLVVIAILVSLPLSWFVMNRWLEDFSYRMEFSWWLLIVAALIAIGISIITISFQSIKTALRNPILSLRSE